MLSQMFGSEGGSEQREKDKESPTSDISRCWFGLSPSAMLRPVRRSVVSHSVGWYSNVIQLADSEPLRPVIRGSAFDITCGCVSHTQLYRHCITAILRRAPAVTMDI